MFRRRTQAFKSLFWDYTPDREFLSQFGFYARRLPPSLTKESEKPLYPCFRIDHPEIRKYGYEKDPVPLGYGSSIHAMFRQNNLDMLCDHTPLFERGFWICRRDEDGREQGVLEVRLLVGDVDAHYLWSMEQERLSRSRRVFEHNKREITGALDERKAVFPDDIVNPCNILVFYGPHAASLGRRVDVVFPDETVVIVQRGKKEILYATPKAQALGIYANRSFESLANIPL